MTEEGRHSDNALGFLDESSKKGMKAIQEENAKEAADRAEDESRVGSNGTILIKTGHCCHDKCEKCILFSGILGFFF